jgi:hypothetical protein
MQRYKFFVLDSNGSPKRGTINSESRVDAISRLEKRGFKVREIELDDDIKEPANGRSNRIDSFETPADDDSEYPTRSRTGLMRSLRSWLPTLIASLALAIAVFALMLVYFYNPLGRGIRGYDFSSPEAAVRSLAQIERNQDFRARVEVELLQFSREHNGEEKTRTFEIHKTANHNDSKLVFVSYTKNGKKVRDVQSFEKDPETKLWMPNNVRTTEIARVNEQLAKEIGAWKTTGTE